MNKVQRLINPLHLEGLHHEADMMRNVDVHRVLYQTCGHQASVLAKSRSCQQHKDESDRNQRLVIFDKDGTLVCIHAMWAPWIRGIAARLENATDLDLANKIFNLVSFDNNTGKIKPGLLGEGTMSQLRDTITQLLSEEGVPREKAERIVQACWQVREMANYGDVRAVGDVGHLFGVLKSNGYLIAVNTSDSRGVTEQTLDHLDLRRSSDWYCTSRGS
ncbi:uncharacterized protein [Amphiura filiformis]|uniref:uncharacterized protein isoform X2 n=1 Tax=Amphiura filiformis TaxID=82378 RepID=UPI003B21BEDA